MPAINKASLITSLCPPLNVDLTGQLLDEFVSQERRYVLQDWEPATLDGGQFTEVASRILYHIDSGHLDTRRSVDKCLIYLEDPKNANRHNYPDRKSALHTARTIRTIYKFRSDRGAIHIDPTYTANHLDSKLVIESVRWLLSEILRLFWTGDRAKVAGAIREILQFDVPVIGNYEGHLLVQRTDCSTDEEILILLHHAGELGLSRTELGNYVQKDAAGVTRSIKKLASNKVRQIVRLESGKHRLTDLGVQKVLEKLAAKLVL